MSVRFPAPQGRIRLEVVLAFILRLMPSVTYTMASPRRRTRPSDLTSDSPTWIAPLLTELVDKFSTGNEWAHEIELDGYHVHASIDRGHAQLLTRTGLDPKYPPMVAARQPGSRTGIHRRRPVRLSETGVTSFGRMQSATDSRRIAALVFYAFDLLYLDGVNLMREPLAERKWRLPQLLEGHGAAIRYCDHQIGVDHGLCQVARG